MKPIRLTKPQLNTAKQMLIAASVCLFSLFGLYLMTHQAAKTSEKNHLVQSLAKLLPKNSFNNNLLASQTQQNNHTVYLACLDDEPLYSIAEIATNKGYSGLIKLLVAVDLKQQKIIQVRPLFHQETPGLGDQIEVEKSNWAKQFNLPLTTPAIAIAVKQDKGQIDAITGATITSRAVSDIIRQTLFEHETLPLAAKCTYQAERQ